MDPAAGCPRCDSPITPQDLACPHCGSQVASFPRIAPSTQEDAAPRLPDRYQVLRMLGRGGMGRVWLCRDLRLDVDVAVKVLPAEISADTKALRRIEEEAKMAARLRRCPNILALYGFEHHEGVWFLVMEYAAGGSLFDRLRNDHRLPERGCRRVGAEVADALAFAHGLGVLHRDIKPGNVLLDIDGRAKVADFGLARIVPGAYGRLNEMPVEGTPVYMAPEVILHRGVDGRADLYALGAMLFELATGAPPFRGSYAEIAMAKTASDARAPDPREFRPDLSADFAAAVTRLMEPDPERRFAGAAICAEDLRRGLPDSGSGRPPVGVPLPIPSPAQTPTEQDPAATPQAPPAELRRRERPVRRSSPWPWLAATAVAAGGGAWLLLFAGKEPAPLPSKEPGPASSEPTPEAVLSEGLVVITKPEGAQVYLDGGPAGTASSREGLRLEGAAEGVPHVVEARLPDHEPARVSGLVWRKGNPREPVVITLVPQKGLLALEGGRPGAKVVLGREGGLRREFRMGADGALPPEVMDAGNYDAEVSLKGFKTWTGKVRVSAARGPAARVEMAESDGTLSLDTDPTGAEVREGQRVLGKAPLAGLALPAGKHRILLVHPDTFPEEVEAAIRGEEALDLKVIRLFPPATLDATSLPDGVAATVAGGPAADYRGKPGSTVLVSYARPGCRLQTREVQLGPGRNAVPPPPGPWVPVPGRLDLSALGADVTLLLDGALPPGQGRTIELAAGVHEIALIVPGLPTASCRLWVPSGETFAVPVPERREVRPPKAPPLPQGWGGALDAGLAWLAAHQSPAGGWDCDGFEAMCRKNKCGGPGYATYDIGVTGLALLAFLQSGSARANPGHMEVVWKGLDWLRGVQDPQGCIGPRTSDHFVYGHAAASLAITEGWRQTGDPRLGAGAFKAVDFVLQCRNPYLAWRYGIQPKDNDTSVTAWMVWALRAGADAGIPVPPDAFEGAKAWLDKVTEPEYGRTGYTARGNGPARPQELMDKYPPDKSESLTAAALFARLHCGADADSDAMVGKGADLCLKMLPLWDEAAGTIDYYYWFFGTRAMHAVGGDSWRRWREAVGKAVVEGQRQAKEDDRWGSWDPLDPWGSDGGRVYSTAINLLALATPVAASGAEAAGAGPRTLLTLRTDPPGAAVDQCGEILGHTPLFEVPAVAGRTTLHLVHPERAALEVPVEVKPFATLDRGTVALPPGATLDFTGFPGEVQAACEGRRAAGAKFPVRPDGARVLFAKPGFWTQVQEMRLKPGEEAKAAPGPWEPAPEWKDAAVSGLPAPPRPAESPAELPPGFRMEGGRIWCERDRAEMVYIPPRGRLGERRTLPGFLADRHEVTVSQFSRFVQALERPFPRKYPGLPRQPVVGVFPEDAAAFASWAGKRLPSTGECDRLWEGPLLEDGRSAWPFPWGFADSPSARNLAGSDDGEGRLAVVGKYLPGMTVHGVLDVAGNAAELSSEGRPRGASFLWRYAGGKWSRSGDEPDLGFRCVASLLFPSASVQVWRLYPETAAWGGLRAFPVLPLGGVADIVKSLRRREPFSSQTPLVDLALRFPGKAENRAAYLLAILQCPAAARVRMITGSDDALRVWINEKPVLQKLLMRGWNPDEDRTDVDLQPGENTVLVEVANGLGPGPCFSLRFEGTDGKPWLVSSDGTLRPGR